MIDMKMYAATFTTGFSEVISDVLRKEVKDVKIVSLSDGLIVFTSEIFEDKLGTLSFLNNSYVLVNFFSEFETDKPMSEMISWVKNQENLEELVGPMLKRRRVSFRIVFSEGNELIKINKERLSKLERKLLIIKGLVLNREKADIEVWFVVRKEGCGFVGLRLTKRKNYEKTLEKGEIYPELACILCLTSDPKESDVFLDPMAGYGAIPMQRINLLPFKKIIIGDINEELINRIRLKVREVKTDVIVRQMDVLNLRDIKDESVDKIVTDPPWGFYSKTDIPLSDFYKQMLKEFVRILKVGGIVVILTAQKEMIEENIKNTLKFKLVKKYNTLVSGKKAGAYKIEKVY